MFQRGTPHVSAYLGILCRPCSWAFFLSSRSFESRSGSTLGHSGVWVTRTSQLLASGGDWTWVERGQDVGKAWARAWDSD